ncbi:MAG: hypothetical protein AAGA03_15750 [Planctomycetota bacterium]
MNRWLGTIAAGALAFSVGLSSDRSAAASDCSAGCCDTSILACDTCCDSGCDALGCGSCGSDSRFGSITEKLDQISWINPSDRCFDDFISPMINFVFFEDPRTVTEVRPIYVNHWVPNTIGNAIPAGGSIQLYAMQFRIALTERLSLIAVKDGFIVDQTEGALDTLLDDGWADVTAGLKYNLLRDPKSGTLLSAGFTYELPIGSTSALQDVGDGEFHLFATGGQRFCGGNAHWLSSFGYRLPVDRAVQNSAVHWSNHFDVKLTDRTYFVTEVAWWHWTDDGDTGAALGVAGQDLFNLAVTDVDGNDLVTQNVGLKFKPTRAVEAGIAYEFPLTDFQDVIEGRLQLDMILRY